MKSTAVFLDRDGTLIEDTGYVDDPEKVRLLPGAAEAVRRFQAAGFRVVLASNQSGVARGLFSEKTLWAVHERLEDLLKRAGAPLDAAYYCPFLEGEEAKIDAYRKDSPLRKPNPGMLLQAAKDLDLDLRRSWMIGDTARDVEAGARAGCQTVLIECNGASEPSTVVPNLRVPNILEAANQITTRAIENPSDVVSEQTSARTDPSTTPLANEPVPWLERIYDQLDRANRRERQHDFSVLRLLGALLQMIAIVSAIWGLSAVLNDQSISATPRLLLACFFQLAALTALGIDRFR